MQLQLRGSIIAVTLFDHTLFGCVHCGHHHGSITAKAIGTVTWECGSCKKVNCLLVEGFTTSSIGFYDGHKKPFYPKIEKHPRGNQINTEFARECLDGLAVSRETLVEKETADFINKIKK